MSPTHYDTLEISQNACQEVVKAAYKALMKKYHPDKHPGESTAEKCAAINAAYDVIYDSVKRRAYDQTLPRQGNSSPTVTMEPTETDDYKWQQFLKKTPSWAKSIPIPPTAWMSKTSPIVAQNGIYNIRPDLQEWGNKIIWVGQQYRISYYEILSELSRTWGYFCQPNSFDMSIVQEQSHDRVNKAFGRPAFNQPDFDNGPVKFGV